MLSAFSPPKIKLVPSWPKIVSSPALIPARSLWSRQRSCRCHRDRDAASLPPRPKIVSSPASPKILSSPLVTPSAASRSSEDDVPRIDAMVIFYPVRRGS